MAVEPYGICRDALVTKYYQALDNIVQLADIACPRHIAKHRNSLVVNALGGKGCISKSPPINIRLNIYITINYESYKDQY